MNERERLITGVNALLPEILAVIQRHNYEISNSHPVTIGQKTQRGWRIMRGRPRYESIFFLEDGTLAAVGQQSARSVTPDMLTDDQLRTVLTQFERMMEYEQQGQRLSRAEQRRAKQPKSAWRRFLGD